MLMHWLMSHDWTQIALASSVLALGVVVALEVQAFARLRREVTRDLARIFEQLDLVRFETQQLRESPVPPARPASAPVASLRTVERSQRAPGERGILAQASVAAPAARDNYSDAARMAADGAEAREIAEKCGLASGEARILVGLQAARSRRINS
jgi:Protein of unknown function (DUF2802)